MSLIRTLVEIHGCSQKAGFLVEHMQIVEDAKLVDYLMYEFLKGDQRQ